MMDTMSEQMREFAHKQVETNSAHRPADFEQRMDRMPGERTQSFTVRA